MHYTNRLGAIALIALDPPTPRRHIHTMERTRLTPRTRWQKHLRHQTLPNHLRLLYCKEQQLVQDIHFATASFAANEYADQALALRSLSEAVRSHIRRWRRKPDAIDRAKVLAVRHHLTRIRYLIGAAADAGHIPQSLHLLLLRRLRIFERVILGFLREASDGEITDGQN